jgi:hypothetical protein
MARWRGQEPGPVIPDWIQHGGFIPSDWVEAADFGLDPRLAVSRAEGRWIAARAAWLNEHLDVAGVLLEQLRERCREKRRGSGAP